MKFWVRIGLLAIPRDIRGAGIAPMVEGDKRAKTFRSFPGRAEETGVVNDHCEDQRGVADVQRG